MRRSFAVLCLLLLFIGFDAGADETNKGVDSSAVSVNAERVLTLTTFNLRWFGLGGTMGGNSASEKRDEPLRDFIAKEIMPADVISFQEVVDVPRLQSLLPQGWACISYQNANPRHQHVVLCASSRYRFQAVNYDNNYTIEEVALDAGRSRPAIRADLFDTVTQKRIVRLVAVHLKAFPQEAPTREAQAEKISEDLSRGNEVLPIIALGDFNTYFSADTGQAKDDVLLIQSGLHGQYAQRTMRFIRHTQGQYTFRNRSSRGQFDQFFISPDLRQMGPLKTFPICNATQEGQGLQNSQYYYTNISDHCPTTLRVSLDNAPSIPPT